MVYAKLLVTDSLRSTTTAVGFDAATVRHSLYSSPRFGRPGPARIARGWLSPGLDRGNSTLAAPYISCHVPGQGAVISKPIARRPHLALVVPPEAVVGLHDHGPGHLLGASADNRLD